MVDIWRDSWGIECLSCAPVGIRTAFHSPNSASMEFPAHYSESKFAAANLLGEVLDTSRFGWPLTELTPCGKPIVLCHSVRDLLRDPLRLNTNIRNGSNLPEAARRQRTGGEKAGSASSVRPQQTRLAINFHSKPQAIEQNDTVAAHRFKKPRMANAGPLHSGTIDDPINLQLLQYLRMPAAVTHGDPLLRFFYGAKLTRMKFNNAI